MSAVVSQVRGGRYAFDDVVVDAGNYRLYKAGALRPVGPRAFDLLLDLVEHADRVVGKEELFDRVWHGVAVTDNALTRAIRELRHALGDPARAPKYIRTTARRGYRFIADARVQLAGDAGPAPERRIDPEARTAVLQGRHFLGRRTAESMAKAVAAFERAAGIEPAFARAHSGVAHALAFLALMGVRSKAAGLERAKAALDRALTLDDRLAEAHCLLGLLQSAEWQNAEAERSLRRAIALDPDEPRAHHWLAMFPLVASGRHEEALAALRRGLRLDPLSLIISADVAGVLCMLRRFDEAVMQSTATLHLDPHFARAHVYLGWARAALGRQDAAIAALETAARLDRTPWTRAWLGHGYGRAGRVAQARQVLDGLLDGPDAGPSERPFLVGLVQAGLGDVDAALASFDRAVAERSIWIAGVSALPMLDGVRPDARFQTLLRRIGAPERRAPLV